MDRFSKEVEDYDNQCRNIQLRVYQLKLLEKAKKENSIIHLPTGSGKTLIAIQVLLSRSKEIRRPFSEGGKRAFFLTHTKVLLYQLCKALDIHTKFKIVGYTGDDNVDLWDRKKWMMEFENNHVLVLTGEILNQILQLNFIDPARISLLVFDECHHAVSDHPFKCIMRSIDDFNPSERPLVLGLTAVLLNSNPKNNRAYSCVKALENTFHAKVITERQLQHSMRFAANPVEKILVFNDSNKYEGFSKLYDPAIAIFDQMSLMSSNASDNLPTGGIDFKNRNKAKRIKNTLVISKTHLEELGLLGGSISALYSLFLLEKFRLLSDNTNEIQALVYARTELIKIRHILLRVVGDEHSAESIVRFSSHKVQLLIQTIRQLKESGTFGNLRILVFVVKRATAVVLAYLFKKLSAADENLSFVKPEFAIGSSVITKDSFSFELGNEEVVNQFSAGTLNLLFATNLLEEGIDVSSCNVVINFDFPLGYPSYFQSRGRARDKNSFHYIFINEQDFTKKSGTLKNFKALEEELRRFQEHTEDDDSSDIDESSVESYRKIKIQGKSETICVDGINAIKAVTRYCMKLPQDKFSLLAPLAWYKNVGALRKGFVQLPMNCPLREVIEGEPEKSKKLAKRSVFLATLQKLVEMGELDQDMNPKFSKVNAEEFNVLFPHYKVENIYKNLPQPGTRKRKQKYKAQFAKSLSHCLPRPGARAYVHVIHFEVAFPEPELRRKVAIYEILKVPVTYALISTKKLFKIFQFPLFLDMGRIDCDILVNYDEIVLTESEISDIKACHFTLFKKVMMISKSFQVFDNRNEEHAFFIAPVEKNEEGRFVLNWELIRSDFCKNSKSALVRYNPSANQSTNLNRGIKRVWEFCKSLREEEEEAEAEASCNSLYPADARSRRFPGAVGQVGGSGGPTFAMNEADYSYFVIVPNYRSVDPPQCYIVNKICRDMSPLSPFPREEYEDFCSYYCDKYKVEITNTRQPLLRASPLYSCSNFNRPRNRKPRRARERVKEYEEHLVPELCDVIPFDRRYWLKALLLPTVLNRIFHVYLVEEFRRRIVSETGLGSYEPSHGTGWRPLEVDKTCAEDYGEDASCPAPSAPALPLSKLKDKTRKNSKIVLVPERHVFEWGMCDMEFFVKRLRQLESVEVCKDVDVDQVMDLDRAETLCVPALKVLGGVKDAAGPDLRMLVQASTAKSANDIVDYERLEILGDSFLKFATTFYLFKNYQENEGLLTNLKGKLVGNRNLLYCGTARDIQDVINVTDFVPFCDWNPPLLRVPERLVEEITRYNVYPAVLYRFEISEEEQYSGVLSESTMLKNEEILRSYDKCFELPPNSSLPYKILEDKTVSDCVEAFIGAYLVTLGVPGALEFLLWLGVLPRPGGSHAELMEKPCEIPLFGSGGKTAVDNVLSEVLYSELEDILNYRFRNKALLLEAITHPSYSKNRVTNCYQRLEFLGDALLDFLITIYVYENFESLTPGQVTDVRSALVNNITFGCLVVRYEIYKYMLSFSATLSKAIEVFVLHQKSRNHVIDENMFFLFEEGNCSMADSIQVPKALGDIFESLAGAIFLDSGNSLETVWKVFYRLMKRELDEFTKNIPKSAVRLLQEICGEKPYYESKVKDGVTKVLCSVYYSNQEVEAHGFGPNKKEGKRSAAKLVLNKILALKNSEQSTEGST